MCIPSALSHPDRASRHLHRGYDDPQRACSVRWAGLGEGISHPALRALMKSHPALRRCVGRGDSTGLFFRLKTAPGGRRGRRDGVEDRVVIGRC